MARTTKWTKPLRSVPHEPLLHTGKDCACALSSRRRTVNRHTRAVVHGILQWRAAPVSVEGKQRWSRACEGELIIISRSTKSVPLIWPPSQPPVSFWLSRHASLRRPPLRSASARSAPLSCATSPVDHFRLVCGAPFTNTSRNSSKKHRFFTPQLIVTTAKDERV